MARQAINIIGNWYCAGREQGKSRAGAGAQYQPAYTILFKLGIKHNVERFRHSSVLVVEFGYSKNSRCILCCFLPDISPRTSFDQNQMNNTEVGNFLELQNWFWKFFKKKPSKLEHFATSKNVCKKNEKKIWGNHDLPWSSKIELRNLTFRDQYK